ncbi:beta strand repeat-containing protein [Limnobacter sp. P1]|uniref:beta strand repeat-containing protein n=1 Tax=Limnobacter olei TaxID=3031298 RepID=UPI0023B13D28|nr:hypothetical protein [Limnobacter sp. P1]
MALLIKNNAYSRVAASLAAGGTTLTVDTGTGDRFPIAASGNYFKLTLQDAANNIEIIKVTARAASSDSLTIERAQEGTTARAWSIGDIVELRLTAGVTAPLQVLEEADTAALIRGKIDVPTRAGGDASGSWNINSATATALQTARLINGVSFNGTANISINLNNSLTPGAFLTGAAFNGSATQTFAVDATSANTASKVVARDASGNFSAGTITAALAGNATTATTLQTARTINGVSFDGSANITITANTPNNITFNNGGAGGGSGSAFNGGAALTVSYNTVGAPSTTGANASGTWGINITGNAESVTNGVYNNGATYGISISGTATTALDSSRAFNYTQSFSGNWDTDFQNAPAGSSILRGDLNGGINNPGATWWFQHNYRHNNSSNFWGVQVAWGWEDNANRLRTRNVQAGSYGAWVDYLNSSNFNSYAPTLTGGGASGTWGISITGNAGSAYGLAVQGSGAAPSGRQVLASGTDGYVYTGYINSNTGNGENPGISQIITTNGDNFYRKSSLAHVGNQLNAAGYQSVTPTTGSPAYYGARAWVNFNGTGVIAIRGSANVSSLTDNASGNYQVNLTTAMPDLNYTVIATGSVDSTQTALMSAYPFANPVNGARVAPLTTGFNVATINAQGNSIGDTIDVCVAVFR